MKKILTFASAVLCAGLVAHAGISAKELVVLALDDALREASASLASAPIENGKTVAVLPFSGDDDALLAGKLKNALTAAGKVCVEGKEDAMVKEILKEIEWDARREDIIDGKTADRFGKLKTAQYLLYGAVRTLGATERYALVEIELHVTSIETKRHVWGGTFAKRYYAPGFDVQGALEIPAETRDALRDAVRGKVGDSLARAKRIAEGMKVVCLPFPSDVDSYVFGLVRDALTQSVLTPVNLDVTTLAEARFALRQGPGAGDAILYGALRDLSSKVVETSPTGKKTSEARLEIQLWIEKGSSREILWSDTLYATKEYEDGPRSWWDTLVNYFPVLRKKPWLLAVAPLVLLVLLGVLIKTLGAATRVR